MCVSVCVGVLEMRGCIHASTVSPDSQAPEAFSEELAEWRGGVGMRWLEGKNWSTVCPDHGG